MKYVTAISKKIPVQTYKFQTLKISKSLKLLYINLWNRTIYNTSQHYHHQILTKSIPLDLLLASCTNANFLRQNMLSNCAVQYLVFLKKFSRGLGNWFSREFFTSVVNYFTMRYFTNKVFYIFWGIDNFCRKFMICKAWS